MRFDVIGKPSRRTCVRVEIHSEPYLRHGAFAARNAQYSGSALALDVHAQTERHQLQRQINRLRTIDIPAMNAHSLVNQQQLPHAPNSSRVAYSTVTDFLEPLIDGDAGTVDFALQAMIPKANVLHAQYYSQEQSVSSLSSSCAAPSYGRCLNRCYSCFREVTITSF